MRAILQRVSEASVEIEGVVSGAIDAGFVVLLGVHHSDTEREAVYLAEKCAGLRVFEDADGKMNRSILDAGGKLLVISNFTLYGNCKKGKRPSFIEAARPELAKELYELFVRTLRDTGVAVETGVFGADMKVSLINDGPVTIFMDTEQMLG